jgi:signal transduction histidine kinase
MASEGRLNGVEVLIVEDSTTQAVQLRFLLQECGYRVTVAANGQEGLAAVRQHKPHLIISDIIMPVMTGYEMCHAIKQDEALQDIPVILLTSLSDPEDIVRGLKAGTDYYVTKPYDEGHLLSTVELALATPVREKGGRAEEGLEITFAGERHVITSDRQQILNLLLSTYGNAVQQNRELIQTQRELETLNQHLEERVQERTVALHAEIVERKRAQESLKEYSGRLEEMVKERTTELDHRVAEVEQLNRDMVNLLEDLQAAKGKLETTAAKLQKANQELNDFAYVVSHDLKAPLRAITQLADWLATDYAESLGEEGQEMVSLLIGRTKRMHNLIQGILEYSRIGRVKEREKRVDLNWLVQDTIEMLAPPEHIQIIVESKLPTIVGEQIRLEQVLQNLLDNAVKFMDKPAGCVTIGCVDEGSHWLFSVADNGPGIEEKYYDKVFQMFQTLAPRDEFESTGVGLALVKKIVETNGGSIWLESEVGKGSTFYFTLPKEGEKHEGN